MTENEVENNRASEDLPEAEIMPTDIVFDCPHCGHNLVVDYRAAGLQVPCVACGKIIQAPIPEGMQLEDLDRDPGELLQQLLQTRRMLVKYEAMISDHHKQLAAAHALIARYEASLNSIGERVSDLQQTAEMMTSTRNDICEIINALTEETETKEG